MNKLQVIDLFGIIKRSYPGFDASPQNVEHYSKYLQDFPYETAYENVEKYILSERFAPTIADIRGKLGDQMDSQRSKEAAAAHIANLEVWGTDSTPPPANYWERGRQLLRGGANA
ncbi:hypothetical protein D3P09_02445 [Paenibacillus pinisoli]|uniref:Uncharacterized protein n=1 Tax=Paenibacillus pinisoli TaxID=1276110 RepID=A0A3A6PKL0_9BACL|nr:replicative helicase loader/inhibitor [Paenibacillus pinisoli]RJX40900.1 hypothetical protein D3P09_02445 [Paenibacillus pinisoli]